MRIIITILALLFFGCSSENPNENTSMVDFTSEEIPVTEFSSWVNEEATHLEKEKKIGQMKFSIRYNPADYMAMIELRTAEINDSSWKEAISHYTDLDYFKLTIEKENVQGELLKDGIRSPAEYEDRLKYYSFGFQNDIQMVSANDTLACSMCHFERSFDISPTTNFLIAFPKSAESNSDKTIIINDRVFGTGRIKFTFSSKELTNYPKVIL
jgi:hypothetical protein